MLDERGPVSNEEIADRIGAIRTNEVSSAATTLESFGVVEKEQTSDGFLVDLNVDGLNEIREKASARRRSGELMNSIYFDVRYKGNFIEVPFLWQKTEMSTRLTRSLGSYNLFAKAFPGVVFLLILLTLLPAKILDFNISESGTIVAIGFFITLILGFVLGQALHALAVRIEGTFYSLSKTLYLLILVIRFFVFRVVPSAAKSVLGRESMNDDETDSSVKEEEGVTFTMFDKIRIALFLGFITGHIIVTGSFDILIWIFIGAIFGIIGPIERLRGWTRSTLIPHRRLFEEHLETYDDGQRSEFKQTVKGVFRWHSSDEWDVYQSVLSHLEYYGGGRALQFQAIFSFCRSLWASLFIYAFFILLFLYNPNPPEFIPGGGSDLINPFRTYEPMILEYFTGLEVLSLGLFMIILGILFMEGERQHKAHFVEYIVVDFMVSTSQRNSETNEPY